MKDVKELNFKILEKYKPVEGMEDEEYELAPSSEGFWYDLDCGDISMFIDMLEDEETRKECQRAVRILSKLERVTGPYTVWF